MLLVLGVMFLGRPRHLSLVVPLLLLSCIEVVPKMLVIREQNKKKKKKEKNYSSRDMCKDLSMGPYLTSRWFKLLAAS
jgi:hypothetical protein